MSPLCFRIGTLLRSLTGLQRSASSVFPLLLASRVHCRKAWRIFLGSGEPPVAWTHGSANFDIQHFQSRALAVSQELKLRCLLLSMDPPDGITPCRRVSHRARALRGPFSPLPCGRSSWRNRNHREMHCRGSAAAHHPALPRPTRQCRRVVRLGLGRTLSYRRMDGADLAAVLKDLLASRTILSRCREFKARLLAEDTLSEVCDWAEEIAERGGRELRLRSKCAPDREQSFDFTSS